MMVGTLQIARAVNDRRLSDEILEGGVTAALALALKAGKVRAYGTDVWFSDPPAPECPLLSAPNVFMAPHLGANSKENLGRIGDEVVLILKDFKA